MMRFMPLIIFAAIALALGIGLTLKPREVPSAMVGKPLPDFSITRLDGSGEALSPQSFQDGQTRLLNVFASWCQPCRIEHPLLMQLAAEGISIVGIAHKDAIADTQKFIDSLGNPYGAIGMDMDGRLGIHLGISGVPETFVINGKGEIIYQHIGYLDNKTLSQKIRPLLLKGDTP